MRYTATAVVLCLIASMSAAQDAAGFSLKSKFTYVKAGWKRGAHAVAIDYAIGEDFNAKEDKATMIGVGYVWNPVRWLERRRPGRHPSPPS